MGHGKKKAPRPANARRRGVGKPFVKGFDPRRNLNGRPRSHDQLRELIREIGAQRVPGAGGLNYLQALLLSMFASRQSRDHAAILEHAFGKVPVELTGAKGAPLFPATVNIFIPDNGREPDRDSGDPAPAGPADAVPGQ